MKDFRARRWQQEDRNPMMTVFEKAGRYPDIIDLSIGDPDLKTPQKIIDLAFADAGAGHTKYTDPWGDPELREEIARFYAEEYGVALGEREIFVSTAGCVAMYLVMEAILDPGDEVLIFDPYFSAYATQVRLGGGVPVFVPCREADGRPTLEAVARFARKNDLLVVADDIYTSFCYSEPFLPVLTLPGMKERTVAINSFSKNFVMTGFRVGNIVAPEPIARAVKSINDSVVYSAPAPSQRAALHALRRRKELAAQIVPEFSARMAYGAQRIRELPGFTLSPAGGGIYLFPGVGPTGLTSAEACERILEEAHVLMLPGSAFGDAGEGYLRIACNGFFCFCLILQTDFTHSSHTVKIYHPNRINFFTAVGLDKMEEAFGRMAQMPMLQGR